MSTQSRFSKIIAALVVWVLIGAAIVFGIRLFTHKEKQELFIDTGSESQYTAEVRENEDEFSGYALNRSDKNKEGLRKDKIRLTLHDDGADYFQRFADMRDGNCDIAVYTVDAFLTAGIVGLKGEFPGKIFLPIDETIGADSAITFGDIKSIDDLKKYKVKFVLTPNSPSEFLARIMIARFTLSLPKDWIVQCNGSGEVYKQFEKDMRNGIPEGPEFRRVYIMWEPHVSRALKANGKKIFGSDKLKAGIFDVMVVSSKFLKEHRELVKSVAKSYLTSVYFYKDKMEDLIIEDAKAHNLTLHVKKRKTS